jgi:hypothetical protein
MIYTYVIVIPIVEVEVEVPRKMVEARRRPR